MTNENLKNLQNETGKILDKYIGKKITQKPHLYFDLLQNEEIQIFIISLASKYNANTYIEKFTDRGEDNVTIGLSFILEDSNGYIPILAFNFENEKLKSYDIFATIKYFKEK